MKEGNWRGESQEMPLLLEVGVCSSNSYFLQCISGAVEIQPVNLL